MAGFDAIADAFVRIRAKDDGTLNRDVQSILGRVAVDAASLFAGKKLLDVGIAGLDELKQAQVVTTQTAVQLRATGEAAGVSAQHIDELGQKMLDLAGFDDEAARSAANVLLQFNQIRGTAAFDRVLKDAGDVAVTLGEDLPAAARTLGLAIQDPEKGLRLLRAANVTLTRSQQDQLKAAEAQNDVGKEQDIILTAVEARVQGAAAAYGQTLTGSLQRAQEEMKNAKAELVAGFTPAIEFGASATTAFAHVVEELPTGLQATVGGVVFLGGGLASLVRPIGDVLRLLDGVRAARAAHAAAALTDVAAEEASAAAALADAAAQGTDAAAIEANAAARESLGLAATASVGIQTALVGLAGPAGVAALGLGALLAVTGLLGAQDHDTTTDVQALTKALQEQGTQGIAAVNQHIADLLTTSSSFPKAFQDADANLKPFIDTIRAGGEDIHAFDRAMTAEGGASIGNFRKALADGHLQASALTDELLRLVNSGKLTDEGFREISRVLDETTGNFSSATDAANAQTYATQGATDATGDNTDAIQVNTSALAAQNQQRQTQLTSVRNVYDAQQAMTQAEHGVATAARGVTDAEHGVESANRRLEDSYRSIVDAQQKVIDAQAALDKAMAGATAEELGKANLDVSDAQLRQADATTALADAQHKLDRDTRLGRTRAIAGDQESLTKAQNDYQRSVFGVTDAQAALNAEQKKGSDQDPAVIQARKDLDAATRGLSDAERDRTDALQGVADAQQRVTDAKDALNSAYTTEADSSSKLADAEANLYGSSESVNTSLRNQIAAFQGIDGLIAPGSPAREHLDNYIKNLLVLAGIFDTSPTFDQPLIIQPAPGGPVQYRAAGGALDRNVPTWLGEDGPELAFHDVIYPTRGARSSMRGASKGGNTYNDNSITINYPEPESSDRALERTYARQSILNGG